MKKSIILLLLSAIVLSSLFTGCQSKNPEKQYVSYGELVRPYTEDVFSAASNEIAYVFPWDYMLPEEKYGELSYLGSRYFVAGFSHTKPPEPELSLGVGRLWGYDIYTDSDKSVDANVFAFPETDPEVCLGVMVEGSYFVYVKEGEKAPDGLVRPSPYRFSVCYLGGTVTQVGDGYFLVDDSVLCPKKKDGAVFRVNSYEFRVSRWFDSGILRVGDAVLVGFTGSVQTENGNTVEFPVSISKATVQNGMIYVEE